MISNMFMAIAYLAMAFAVEDLSFASEDSALGRRRVFILSVLAAAAALQMAQLGAAYFAWAQGLRAAQILSAFCLLALPFGFWPVVGRLKQGKLRVINRRLLARALRAEAAQAGAQRWLQLAEQSGHVGHWQLTVPDNRLFWSDEIYRIQGLWREYYRPRIESALAAFHPLDGKRLGALLQETAANKGRFEAACRLRRPDGEIRHVVLRAAAHLGADGRVESINGVMVDLTEPRRARAKAAGSLREMALEDALTGLADRAQFELSLGYEFKRAVRSHKPLGMVLLEIDHFRALSAHYGQMEADTCLRTIAQAVQAMPRRTGDIVARYGQAEIALLLPLADAAGVVRVAGAVAEAVRALGLPNAGHESGMLSISLGAAAFTGADDLYNPQELTRRAERALADAKGAGGNQLRGYHAAPLFEALRQRA